MTQKQSPKAPPVPVDSDESEVDLEGTTDTPMIDDEPVRARVHQLFDHLPKHARMEALMRVAERIEVEGQKEVQAAVERVAGRVRALHDHVSRLEERAEVRLDDFRERVQQTDAAKAVLGLSEKVGDRATAELDELLERMGLIRRQVVDEQVAALEKKLKAAQRALAAQRTAAAKKSAKRRAE